MENKYLYRTILKLNDMKFRSLFLAVLSGLAITAGFTSCSDDDDWDWSKEGSKVEMSENRAFIINEGSMNKNNATMTYFDWTTDQTYKNDLFITQNGTLMGDVWFQVYLQNEYRGCG